jgi:hypothetical protein
VQVLLDYGVYADTNSQPGYLLTLSLPREETDRCYFDKLDILEQQGMKPSETFTLQARKAPPPEMLAFLRLINISGV